jgi:hypothetical protein
MASASSIAAAYVFRVAIGDHRILACQDESLTFAYRKSGSHRWRRMRLEADEFLRRFLQHVLPSGFQKVRHYGFLHPRSRTRSKRSAGSPPCMQSSRLCCAPSHPPRCPARSGPTALRAAANSTSSPSFLAAAGRSSTRASPMRAICLSRRRSLGASARGSSCSPMLPFGGGRCFAGSSASDPVAPASSFRAPLRPSAPPRPPLHCRLGRPSGRSS